MAVRRSPESVVKDTYKKIAGDFSFRSLANITIVVLATLFLPFFGAGFSFDIFYTDAEGIKWGFFIASAFKIAMNVTIKKTMADHTYDNAMKKDEEIERIHHSIMQCKNIITQEQVYDKLKTKIDIFNEVNALNAADDILEEKMSKSKDDALTDKLFEAQTNIRKYIGVVQSGEIDDDLRREIISYTAGVKADRYSTASIFSKSDTIKRAKRIEHSRKKQIDKRIASSTGFAVVSIVATNAVEFIRKGWNGDSIVQALINTVLLTWSATQGAQIGNEAIQDYKQVMSDKEDFLISFISGLGLSHKLETEVR